MFFAPKTKDAALKQIVKYKLEPQINFGEHQRDKDIEKLKAKFGKTAPDWAFTVDIRAVEMENCRPRSQWSARFKLT